jgi:hypothetical protein
VPARIETNMPSRRPERDSRTWRFDMDPSGETVRRGAFAGDAAAGWCWDMILRVVDYEQP